MGTKVMTKKKGLAYCGQAEVEGKDFPMYSVDMDSIYKHCRKAIVNGKAVMIYERP